MYVFSFTVKTKTICNAPLNQRVRIVQPFPLTATLKHSSRCTQTGKYEQCYLQNLIIKILKVEASGLNWWPEDWVFAFCR